MKPLEILVPIDFTSSSKAALEAAIKLAHASRGRLLIMHVYEPGQGTDDIGVCDALNSHEDMLFEKLHAFVPDSAEVCYEPCVLKGKPVDVILKTAEEEKVDFIVMGTHGRRKVDRASVGSVAEAVLRRAACPVMTIKAGWSRPVPSHLVHAT